MHFMSKNIFSATDQTQDLLMKMVLTNSVVLHVGTAEI